MSDPANIDGEAQTAAIVAAAESVLQERFGGPVRLEVRDTLRDRYRNRVLRLAVTGGEPDGVPETVIAKAVVGSGDGAYDPENDDPSGVAWRFYNEWAANAFLGELGAEPPLAARTLGARRSAGVLVLEDLGAPSSLADRMLAEDRPALERALLAYAASMGRLHAATAGRHSEFEAIRRGIGGGAERRDPADDLKDWRRQHVRHFRDLCDRLDVPVARGFDQEAKFIADGLADAGPFLAFAPGDTCPDNHRIQDDGTLRFFDFEFAGFRHALLDAAYFYMPFPTCWCVNQLPEPAVAAMEAAYRQELARSFPAASVDDIFLPGLAQACAYWAVLTISWELEGMLEADKRWGIATARQRPPVRLTNFCRVAERAGMLPAFTETARALAAELRGLWEDETEEMPLYPAFRGPAGS